MTNLDPDLLGAVRQAATDAAGDEGEFYVNSGWRSAEYQEQLLREAISEYGSEEEASRWVATPETSAHVSGDAVDIGPSDAAAWLSGHGSEYGLCQIYRNEPWHYELRPEAIDHGCPPMYADPTQDPRMQQRQRPRHPVRRRPHIRAGRFQLVGNLLLLSWLSLGTILTKLMTSIPKITALAAGTSLLIECLQYTLNNGRIASLSDLALNTAGAAIVAWAGTRMSRKSIALATTPC